MRQFCQLFFYIPHFIIGAETKKHSLISKDPDPQIDQREQEKK